MIGQIQNSLLLIILIYSKYSKHYFKVNYTALSKLIFDICITMMFDNHH
jgi:hypothetical protein